MTFMHILGCLDRPTTGRYVLNGRDVSTLPVDELAGLYHACITAIIEGTFVRSSAGGALHAPDASPNHTGCDSMDVHA